MRRPWWLEPPTNFGDGFRKGIIQANVFVGPFAWAFLLWRAAR